MIGKYPFLRVMALLLLYPCIAFKAYALDCSTPSPNMQSAHNVWAPVPAQNLSDKETDTLFTFLQGITGSWKGSGETTECRQSGNSTEAKKTSQELKLSIVQNFSKTFTFNAEVFDTILKMHKQYHFSIAKTIQGIQVSGEGGIELFSLSGSGLRFRTQTLMQQPNNLRNIRISLEIIRKLSMSNGKLMFSNAVFHNGSMINFSDWEFSKN